MRSTRLVVVLLLALLGLAHPAAAVADAGVWNGSIALPGGQKLDFIITITGPDAATMDIPAQGLKAGALADVKVEPMSMRFTLKPTGAPERAWAIFDVKTDDTGKAASGTMKQMGGTFDVTMVRADAAAAIIAARGQPEGWKGTMNAPGAPLDFELKLYPASKPLYATLSIPAQGVTDSELKNVSLEGRTLRFTFGTAQMPEHAHAHITVTLADDRRSAQGTMKQVGMDIPVIMSRLAEGETVELRRPQHPRAPFPYTSREVEVVSFDGAKLPGTLTIPAAEQFGHGPHPAALLITGSGTQDRDVTLFGHKLFLVIADHLTRHGVAVLRVDDRGYNGHFDPAGPRATTATLAKDAEASVAFLREQKDINPDRVGLVGHSEGGTIAPMVAAEDPKLAFIVLLAGTGVTGAEIIRLQSVAMAAAANPAADNPKSRQAAADLAKAMLRDAPEAELRPILVALADGQIGPNATKEQRDAALAQAEMSLVALQSPWMRYFAKLDPAEALRRVRSPVLALNGQLDTQVDAKKNLDAIAAALAAGGNTRVKIKPVPALNHLFQPAKTGGSEEYTLIETTFDPATLELITGWIGDQVGLGKPESR